MKEVSDVQRGHFDLLDRELAVQDVDFLPQATDVGHRDRRPTELMLQRDNLVAERSDVLCLWGFPAEPSGINNLSSASHCILSNSNTVEKRKKSQRGQNTENMKRSVLRSGLVHGIVSLPFSTWIAGA